MNSYCVSLDAEKLFFYMTVFTKWKTLVSLLKFNKNTMTEFFKEIVSIYKEKTKLPIINT